MAKKIQIAEREMRRLIVEGVGRSFLKSLTEPLTNADSILKKQACVPHAVGLVHELLTLKVGERINTTEIKTRLKKGAMRTINVEIFTAGRRNRFCRITDTGTGMSSAELNEKFGTYASAKALGEKTRSLFGRGALDVLLYHHDSMIYSVRDGILSSCRISLEDLVCDVKEIGRATKANLQVHRRFEQCNPCSKCQTMRLRSFKPCSRNTGYKTISSGNISPS